METREEAISFFSPPLDIERKNRTKECSFPRDSSFFFDAR